MGFNEGAILALYSLFHSNLFDGCALLSPKLDICNNEQIIEDLYKSIQKADNENSKKENMISEISIARSIDEVKHILNDPKYSHISRMPNNKWWIEISAIIDDVIAWKLPITYIPSEIRQKVQELIKK